MTSAELIAEGTSLMLFGMGFVFLFLAILVLATNAMSTIINRYYPQPVPATPSEPQVNAGSSASDQGELVAAISAAIQMHRTRNKQATKRQ